MSTSVAIVVGNPTAGDISRDTARRICAAVNACLDFSTAALESGALSGLLAACEGLDYYVAHELLCPTSESGYEPDCTCRVAKFRKAIRNLFQ